MAVRAEIEDGRIYIDSQYADKETCKILPGSRWDKDSRRWHIPISWASCKILRSTFGDRLEIGPRLIEWAAEEVKTRIAPSMALRGIIKLEESHYIAQKLKELDLA